MINLLHSEWPKLHRVLAILNAKGLRKEHLSRTVYEPGYQTVMEQIVRHKIVGLYQTSFYVFVGISIPRFTQVFF